MKIYKRKKRKGNNCLSEQFVIIVSPSVITVFCGCLTTSDYDTLSLSGQGRLSCFLTWVFNLVVGVEVSHVVGAFRHKLERSASPATLKVAQIFTVDSF